VCPKYCKYGFVLNRYERKSVGNIVGDWNKISYVNVTIFFVLT